MVPGELFPAKLLSNGFLINDFAGVNQAYRVSSMTSIDVQSTNLSKWNSIILAYIDNLYVGWMYPMYIWCLNENDPRTRFMRLFSEKDLFSLASNKSASEDISLWLDHWLVGLRC